MDFGISTCVFGGKRLTVDHLETLRKAGYRRIELFAVRPHLDFHDRGLLRSVGRWFQENTMAPQAIHLPFIEYPGTRDESWISPFDAEKRNREMALDTIKRSLELAEFVSPEYLVLHFGAPGQSFNPALFEFAYTAIARINAFTGVPVFLENGLNDASALDHLQEFKSAAQLPDQRFCYDIGHAHLRSAGERGIPWDDVRAVHINDNGGGDDEHLWPFHGTLNWPAFVAELLQAKYDGSLTFEVSGTNLADGQKIRDRLDGLWREAQGSIEEFRIRHHLPGDPRSEE
jgi:sugar phosphate isomerase/epimerase